MEVGEELEAFEGQQEQREIFRGARASSTWRASPSSLTASPAGSRDLGEGGSSVWP